MIQNKFYVASFYSFVNVEDCGVVLQKLLLMCKRKSVKGTIIIASEGINGSIAGDDDSINAVVRQITDLLGASTDLNIKINYCSYNPFDKLKIKLKNEIISIGVSDINTNALVGKYVDSSRWDDFIQQNDCIVIDTRNDYETNIGAFKNAIIPSTRTFKQFPQWIKNNMDLLRGKKVAMYCTGGIRCVKSTAYLKSIGHDEVYHLKGGILQYLYDTKNVSGVWKGQCFVFDNRIAVNSQLEATIIKNNEYE